jgi:glycosyltransferase involved in cell wall biosynthesis
MTDKILRIGIDISTLLNHGPDIGAGRYILNLVKNLLKIDKKNTYILTGRYITEKHISHVYDLKKPLKNSSIELKLYKTSQKKLDLWDRLRFPPLEFLGFKADVFHCPDYLIPPTLSRNIILSIHDLAFIRFPEFNFEWFIKKYTREVKRNAHISKKIIADSKSTKNDIVKFFKIDPGKVVVIPLAADKTFKTLASGRINKSILKKYRIDNKYILSVGTIEPRKNIMTLIKVFNHLKQKKEVFDYQLVIAGRTGWKSEATYRERDKSPFKEDILFIGRVPDSDLVQIYNQAELFVYPSLFEGFGLPPLEAMSCGLPVIAFNNSSLKEVIGDSGILIPPEDDAGLEKQILYVLENKKIKSKLKKKSILKSNQFSWTETARKTLNIYRKIIL